MIVRWTKSQTIQKNANKNNFKEMKDGTNKCLNEFQENTNKHLKESMDIKPPLQKIFKRILQTEGKCDHANQDRMHLTRQLQKQMRIRKLSNTEKQQNDRN
jgi:hypothetical protein